MATTIVDQFVAYASEQLEVPIADVPVTFRDKVEELVSEVPNA